MIQIAIVEDEQLAANHLKKAILKCRPQSEIVTILPSVDDAVEWFGTKSADLVFMDIQLEDGLSFEIFDAVSLQVPVIFTTAFDQYAIKAFKVNSIDYLLKPIDQTELEGAFKKFDQHFAKKTTPDNSLKAILQVKNMLLSPYKSRFMTKAGHHIRSIPVDEAAFFHVREKSVFLHTFEGRDYALDFTLDQLEEQLDPQKFFRINRSFIINFNAMADLIIYSSSRLLIKTTIAIDDEITVSREKVKPFKEWLDR